MERLRESTLKFRCLQKVNNNKTKNPLGKMSMEVGAVGGLFFSGTEMEIVKTFRTR